MAARLTSLRRWAVAALLAASAVGPALAYGNEVCSQNQNISDIIWFGKQIGVV